jgi:xanthine/uracil/vitamin C permease (AzgA family)
MKKNDLPVFSLTIVAIIVGVALFKLIDFKNFTIERPALATIYFVTFAFSIYILAKHYKNKSKN